MPTPWFRPHRTCLLLMAELFGWLSTTGEYQQLSADTCTQQSALTLGHAYIPDTGRVCVELGSVTGHTMWQQNSMPHAGAALGELSPGESVLVSADSHPPVPVPVKMKGVPASD
jgi:hypothetical protein